MSWTDERIDRLKALWTKGMTASHIADELGGVSRNAVIGKAHRLVIDPSAANEPAIRAYSKVGFKPVGRLRRSWRRPDGTWEDQLLMDLLADELT